MTTWQELSAVERRVLEYASEDYIDLWELGARVALFDRERGGHELPGTPQVELQAAVWRLLDLGLVELVQRTGLHQRALVAAAERAALLMDPASWGINGPMVIEVVGTYAGVMAADAGRSVWLA